MKAIETRELTKKFGEHIAVDALNLSVEQGEIFALLGLNGAGKTTAIKMLCCLIPPTKGEAFLGGSSILKESRKVKQKINLSPQETAIAMQLTVRENLEMIAKIYGKTDKEAAERAEELLDRFELREVEQKRAKKLSGGYQRRLSIAMALISQPEILFLDEPTLGLDVLARRKLWKLIEGLKNEMTIVLTTHYLEEVEALSDRIGIMSRGKLKTVGTVEEILLQTGKETLEEAFLELAEEEIK